MRFCIAHGELPCHDRTSGGLRLYTLVALLREAGHPCDYLLTTPAAERTRLGHDDYARYIDDLTALGVRVIEGTPPAHHRYQWDVVIFEWYMTATALLTEFRAWHPNTRMVIDSVDLTFRRWEARAALTQLPADRDHAARIRREELASYRRADLVLTLTPEESADLQVLIPGLPCFEIPNIHAIPLLSRAEATDPELLFIGSFSHQPNTDAVRWFRDAIWPAIRAAEPRCRWTIIGAEAPEDIATIADPAITVTGRVPDTQPYLTRAWLSVAPLRFGAGMKGKVGEALAAGVPVLTTPFGAQGYGLCDGVSAVIAADADGLVAGALRLLGAEDQRHAMGMAGREAVIQRFSREVIAARIPDFIALLAHTTPRARFGLPALARLAYRLRDIWQRHLAWRLRRSATQS